MNFSRDLEGHEEESALRFDSLTLVQLIPVELLAEDDGLAQESTYLVDLPQSYPEKEKIYQPIKYKDLEMKDGRYACPYCEKTYSKKYLVPRHIKMQHENKRVACKLCGNHVRNIFQHYKKTHSVDTSVKCIICLQIFRSKVLMREHCLEDHGEECTSNSKPTKMMCPVCNVQVINKRSLWISHIFYQHMVPQHFYTCPLPNCEGKISKIEDEHNLKTHLLNTHELKPEKIYTCAVCPKKALSEEDLEVHANDQHKDNEFPCVACSQVFSCYSMMALHLYQTHKCIFRGKSNSYKNISESLNSQGFDKPSQHKRSRVDQQRLSNEEPEIETEKVRLKLDKSMPLHIRRIETSNQIKIEEPQLSKPFESIKTKHSFVQDIQLCKVGKTRFATAFPNIRNDPSKFSPSSVRHSDGVKIKEDEETIIIEIDDKVREDEDITPQENAQQIIDVHQSELIVQSDYEEDSDESETEMFIEIDETSNETIENAKINEQSFILHPNSLSLAKDKEQITHNPTSPNVETNTSNQLHKKIILKEVQIKSVEPLEGEVNKDTGKYKCSWPGCSKEFVHKSSVSMHIRNVHQAEKIKCDLCGKSYSNIDNYKTHLKSVHKGISTPCTWPGCSKVLSSKRQLQGHILKHKQSCKPCPFSDCHAVLKNSVTLRTHIKKVHGSRKNCGDSSSCEVCIKRRKMKLSSYHRTKTKLEEEKCTHFDSDEERESRLMTDRAPISEDDQPMRNEIGQPVAVEKKCIQKWSKSCPTITTYSFKNK